MEVQCIIAEILKGAYEFTLEADLTAGVQNSALDPNLKTHLPIAIGKLGRYYSTASELVCAARDRNCPLFRSVQVKPFHIHGRFHIPRTHGIVYDKWILPDWLEIPTERRRYFSNITAQFKAIIDDKIRQTLKSKQSSYIHPNESVLLLEAHWSSLAISETVMSKSQNSTSTIRPRPSTITQGEKTSKLSAYANSPPTPPQTPQKPPRSVKITRQQPSTHESDECFQARMQQC
jgi:hypothetical protein